MVMAASAYTKTLVEVFYGGEDEAGLNSGLWTVGHPAGLNVKRALLAAAKAHNAAHSDAPISQLSEIFHVGRAALAAEGLAVLEPDAGYIAVDDAFDGEGK
jgi:hypothetical protein